MKMEIEQNSQCCAYLDEYRILKDLGAGFHAQVKLGIDDNGNMVAIKKYKAETASLNTLKHQLDILRNFNHANIVKLISCRENAIFKDISGQTQNCFAIILEYVGGGELFDFVAESGKFSEKVTRTYFFQMMNGLHHMHTKGYAHRDIKPENILLSNEFVLKLTDFGFSCLIKGKDGQGILHTKLGTEGYMAPQIPTKNYVGTRTDVFAAGVILFIMYAGTPPFEKGFPNDPYYKLIVDKNFTTFWKAHSRKRTVGFFTDQFKDLFVKMVAFKPEERLTIEQMVQHPWVKGPICTQQQIVNEFTVRLQKVKNAMDANKAAQAAEMNNNVAAYENQGAQARGNSTDESTNDFISSYSTQLYLQRKLPTIEDPDFVPTFVLKEPEPYVISLLKTYFKTKTINIGDPESLDNLQDSLTLIEIIDTNSDKILVHYGHQTVVEDEEFEQILQIQLCLARNSKGLLTLNLNLMEGNFFYFKKFLFEMRKLLEFARA